jgi:general secretion pathway protein D
MSRGTGEFVGRGDVAVPAKTVKGADGVTINLLNAPVTQAAKTILGDVLKANYVVSDKVAGTVTVQTTSPVEPAALADIFEAVLKANGIALVQAEGHYRIVPLAAAGSAPVSLNGQARGPGIGTRIVPLKYIAAAEMRRVIEPMVDKGAILRVDDQRNLLVVNGTGRELANLETLVSIFDVDWMRGMSFALFPVRTTDPEVIAKELETVFGLDKDGALKGVVRIVPNGRLNSVLVMSSRPEHLDTARTWLARFEKLAEEKEEQIYTYRVQNRPAAELAGILQKVLATKEEQTAPSGPAGVAPRFESATVVSPPSSARDGRVSVSTTGVVIPVPDGPQRGLRCRSEHLLVRGRQDRRRRAEARACHPDGAERIPAHSAHSAPPRYARNAGHAGGCDRRGHTHGRVEVRSEVVF